MNEKVRLSKVMSERGLCSRREADRLIAEGLVKVDGAVVSELGTKIDPQAQVELLPAAQRRLSEQVTIILNKPKGFVSAQPEDGHRAAVELVTSANQDPKDQLRFRPEHRRGLAPAGRLDIDSQGLLLLTQNGVLAKQIIGQDSEVEKEYLVRVKGSLSPADLLRLNNGSLVIEGRQLKPAKVEWMNDDQLRFVLREGMKRQIRKMCESVGLEVTGLKRVRIGHLPLANLPEGKWRFLGKNERIF